MNENTRECDMKSWKDKGSATLSMALDSMFFFGFYGDY
jgi:hypothetical protein